MPQASIPIITAIASAATAGAAVYSATQKPAKPAQLQPAKAPGLDAFRNRPRSGAQTLFPNMTTNDLLSGNVPGAGVATSTLLGQ